MIGLEARRVFSLKNLLGGYYYLSWLIGVLVVVILVIVIIAII